MKPILNDAAMTAFGPADLPPGERAQLEIQIMEHALAAWLNKQHSRPPALDSPHPAKPKVLKSHAEPHL